VKGFGSDNHSGVHPRIMKAIEKANVEHAPSYGTDEITIEAVQLFKKLFSAEAETFFVFNGTAANVLSLSALVRPHHSVLVSQQAHLTNDECNAPERHLGVKLINVPTKDGKLRPDDLRPYLVRRGDQHAAQVKAISITQPTEVGTVYSLEEIRALGEFAKREKLFFHMDGARLVNAAESLKCTFREMTLDCGVDVLSFGGTKNGLMFGEAVVFLNPALSEGFKFVRKQLMQLPSKTRFVAAQFLEFLGTDLWRENAHHANQMAKLLSEGLNKSPLAKLTQETQANGVFVQLPKNLVSKLREVAFFYVWDERTFECRLMTTWDTSPDEIQRFLTALSELSI
jgi:threonine aldolase